MLIRVFFMKQRILTQSFYNRPVLRVAEELLGTYLIRLYADGTCQDSMITEVESYDGEKDLACHASKGRTKRTEVMYGPAGHWYIYLCYGMYYMLNVVTGAAGYPAAVLIRGLSDALGPGILTKKLGITKELNSKSLTEASGLWIEDRGVIITKKDIMRTPRIGVSYAKEWADKPYRFVMKKYEITK